MKILPQKFLKEDTLKTFGQAQSNHFHGEIRLLVWNIYKGKKKNWFRDFKPLAHKANLILLQESLLNDKFIRFLNGEDGYEWHMAQSFMKGNARHSTGVKTGCRVAATKIFFYKSPHREPVTGTPKMILGTCYSLGPSATDLLVLNVHAINFVTNHKFSSHMQQVIDSIENHQGPVILAGDFNTWSSKRTSILMEIVDFLHLTRVDIAGSPKKRHFNKILDHIFYRNLQTTEHRSMKEIGSSDHHPLEVVFSISET